MKGQTDFNLVPVEFDQPLVQLFERPHVQEGQKPEVANRVRVKPA